jgi:transposase InsO family protein
MRVWRLPHSGPPSRRADRQQVASITPTAVAQYAAEDYRAELAKHGLNGSMGRRGNPYDNAKAESFMKTLKVEEVYLMEYETSTTSLPLCRASSKRFIMPSATRRSDTRVLSSLNRNTPGRWPVERHHARPPHGVHSR